MTDKSHVITLPTEAGLLRWSNGRTYGFERHRQRDAVVDALASVADPAVVRDESETSFVGRLKDALVLSSGKAMAEQAEANRVYNENLHHWAPDEVPESVDADELKLLDEAEAADGDAAADQ